MSKILNNLKSLLNSFIIDRIFNTVSFLLIARMLVEADYGIFSVALAFAGIFAFLGDLGMSNTLIREVNGNPKGKYIYLTSFIKIKIIFALLSIIFAMGVGFLLYTDELLVYTSILTISMIIGNFLFTVSKAFYQAIQEMKYIAKISFVSSIVTFVGVLLLFIIGSESILLIIIVYSFSKLLGGYLAINILKNHLKNCLLNDWDKSLLNGLVSFSLGGIILLLISQAPAILLGKLTTLENVGIFSVAHRIPLILYTLPGVIAGSYYPQLFKFNKRIKIHIKLITSETKITFIISLLLILPFILEPEFIISLLFGEKWISATPLLVILIYLVVFQSINFPLGDALSTLGKQTYRNLVYVFGLLNIIIGFMLVNHFTNDALILYALVLVMTELLILIGFSLKLFKYFKAVLKGILIYFLIFIVMVNGSLIISNSIPIINIIFYEILFGTIILLINKNLVYTYVSNKVRRKK